MIKVKNPQTQEVEQIETFCEMLSKKNNSVLYLLEDYLGMKLLTDEHLKQIRDQILSVSAEIKRLPSNIEMDSDEK